MNVSVENDLVVCVDPGAKHCGLAIYFRRKLIWCGLARTEKAITLDKQSGGAMWLEMGKGVYKAVLEAIPFASRQAMPLTLVLERPQVYPKSKGDPNDLITLAGVGGVVAGILYPEQTITFLPREWKGTVPKDIFCQRIVRHLEPEERPVLKAAKVPKSLEHNVIDAIGLGLRALGRFHKYENPTEPGKVDPKVKRAVLTRERKEGLR